MIVKFGLLLTISCFIIAEVRADVGEYILMNINSKRGTQTGAWCYMKFGFWHRLNGSRLCVISKTPNE